MATRIRSMPTAHDSTRRLWNAISFAWMILATIALGGLALSAYTTPYLPIDLTAAHLMQSLQDTWFRGLMLIASWPGYPPQVYAELIVLISFLALTHHRWEAVSVGFAGVGIGVVGLMLKMWVNRPRPSPALIQVWNPNLDGGKYSFTAGHVESFVAILGFVAFLAYVARKPSMGRTLAIAIATTLIVLIGPSRVYSGEHWLTDVVGGYLLGSIWVVVTIYFYEWGKSRFFKKDEMYNRIS